MRALLSFRMAYRHIRAKFGQVALSIVAIALGVALVVAIQLMNDAVLTSFLDDVDAMAGRAALSVTASDGVTFDEEMAEKLKNEIPGIILAVPLVTAIAFPDDGSGELLTVHAINLGDPATVEVYHRGDPRDLIVDKRDFFTKVDSIVLAREFAARRRITVGDTIDLVTPVGVKRFTVRGFLDPEGLARTLRGRLVVMDLYAAEAVFTGPGKISQIDLVVVKGQEEAVKKAVAAKLSPGLKVEEPELRKDVIRNATKGFRALVTAFSILAVLAGFLVCFSRLVTIFEARTWEVGLFRAVGLPRLTVFTELLKESLLLGVLGIAPGILLGVVIGRNGLPLMARTMALQFRAPVSSADPQLTIRSLVVGAAVGLAAAAIAAVLPAVRLARKQPVAALTMRGRELPADSGRIRWKLRAGLVVTLVGLIVLQIATNASSIGNLTTLVVALAACGAAAPLVRAGSEVLIRAWPRLLGPTGQFTATHLQQQGRRASLMVATLGAGLGVVLMFGMLDWSFERTLASQLTARYRAELVVTSAFVSGGYLKAPLSETVRDEVGTFPGVAGAGGWQRRSITYKGSGVVIDGYDPIVFTDSSLSEWPLAAGASPDALADVVKGKAVIVSSSFAHLFDTRVGDLIHLDSPNGPQEFRVVAVTNTEPTPAIIMSRDVYRLAWNDSMITWLFVALQKGAERIDVEDAIRRQLGQKHRLTIQSSNNLIDYFVGMVHEAFRPTYLAEAITFILVLIGVGDTLAMGVLERTREFGMMRAVGLFRFHLFALVMLEGVTIGLLGLLLAVVAGMALGLFWVNVQFPALAGWVVDLHVPYLFASAAAGLALLLCIAGSFLPSMRAALLSVPAALRSE